MILDILLWFISNWLILVWMVAVAIAYTFGGWKLALVVGSLGSATVLFKMGQDNANKSRDEHDEKIESERENAYVEIDDRDTDRDDVIERLRKHGY